MREACVCCSERGGAGREVEVCCSLKAPKLYFNLMLHQRRVIKTQTNPDLFWWSRKSRLQGPLYHVPSIFCIFRWVPELFQRLPLRQYAGSAGSGVFTLPVSLTRSRP